MQSSATATCGAHLKNLAAKLWWIAALASWGITLFEYFLMVPATAFMGAVYFIFRG